MWRQQVGERRTTPHLPPAKPAQLARPDFVHQPTTMTDDTGKLRQGNFMQALDAIRPKPSGFCAAEIRPKLKPGWRGLSALRARSSISAETSNR